LHLMQRVYNKSYLIFKTASSSYANVFGQRS